MSAAPPPPSDYRANRNLYTKERMFDCPRVGQRLLLVHNVYYNKKMSKVKDVGEVVSVGPKQVKVRLVGYDTLCYRLDRRNPNGEFELQGSYYHSKYILQPVDQ